MKPEEIIKEEYLEFTDWAKSSFKAQVAFQDPLHARLVDVAQCMYVSCRHANNHAHATPTEFAVLLRQIVRRYKDGLGKEVVVQLPQEVDGEVLSRVGVISVPVEGGFQSLSANPWRPDWLDVKTEDLSVDDASLSPLDKNARARFLSENSTFVADREFREATGNLSYRSPGQLAAVRSALSTSPGSTLIVQLPTGGGKTDVAISVLKSAAESGQTSVLVVPTVALAIDMERRIRSVIAQVWGYEDTVRDMPIRWTGTTSPEERDQMRLQISTGEQPILITSPESLAFDNGVGVALETAAANGKVGWLIVDEAHMIHQWGQDFRPEFLDIAPLRNILKSKARSNGNEQVRTLLLSATYTADSLQYLVEKFRDDSPIHLSAANELRSEIEIWTDFSELEEDRLKKFDEAINHLPRPLIVYATRPTEAERLCVRIKSLGYNRVATFSGKTVACEREDVLQGFRNDLGSASVYDVVVATSAFGLGVDYDQVRSVVHACLPETIDRWYQEIGRGGRDGYSSIALTLTCRSDFNAAKNLGISRLTPENAWKRLMTIRANLDVATQKDESWRYMDINENRPGVERGSHNRRWNKQLLRGLKELGILDQRMTWWAEVPLKDRQKLEESQKIEDEARTEILQVKVLQNYDEKTFKEMWQNWKEKEANSSEISLSTFQETLARRLPICELLSDTYTDSHFSWNTFSATAENLSVGAKCGLCHGCRRNNLHRSPEVPNPYLMFTKHLTDQEVKNLEEFRRIFGGSSVFELKCGEQDRTLLVNVLTRLFPIQLVTPEIDLFSQSNSRWVDSDITHVLWTPDAPLMVNYSQDYVKHFRKILDRHNRLGKKNIIVVFGDLSNESFLAESQVMSSEAFLYELKKGGLNND